jgi:hypothetical protein
MWRNKERGEGQGTGGERQGDGGADECVCPKCGATIEHEKGMPCSKVDCPECGATMEGKEQKATWSSAYIGDLPDSSFLYVDSDGKRHLPYKDAGGKVDLPHLRNAISRLGQPATGTGENAWLTEALRKRLLARAKRLLESQKKSLFDRAVDWLKEAVGVTDEPEPEHNNTFLVWKQDNGCYRWLAVYSNKFRDEDLVPEILSESAHRDFVKAVDAGDWPMPELWLWHVGGTMSGAADYVAYDDSGFSLASGLFDEGKERIAAALAEQDGLLTSHGMPAKEIERDTEDPTIITRYRSKEISPLPGWAAANKHGTHFTILKEVDMALPKSKPPFLEAVMGKDAVDDLEHQLEDKAKELETEGIEFKEGSETAEPEPQEAPAEVKAEVGEAVEAAEVGAEPEPEAEPEPQPEYVTHEQLEEVFASYVRPLVDGMTAVQEQVASLGKELKELQRSDEEKVQQALKETPAASLTARIGSVIGAPETLVDGRSSLAKSGPNEQPARAEDGPTLVPWLNNLISRQQYGGG